MRPEGLDTNFKTIVNSLIESLDDKEEHVNNTVKKSLCKIANNQNVDSVLSACCEYRTNKKKMRNEHVANIFSTMEQICLQKAQVLNVDTVEQVMNITITEMVSHKEYIPTIQMSASGILVALSNVLLEKIITKLMDLLQPGVIPHFTIPHTLGAIAAANSNDSVPFIKPILAKMLPTLGMLRNDPLKQAFAYALGNFSTALIDHLNNENNKGNSFTKDNLSTEFSIAFDILFIHWVHSNESKVVETILEAMGPMTNLLPTEKYEALVPKLIPSMFTLYKKPNLDSYFVTQAVTYVLMRVVKNKSLLTAQTIDNINTTLFSLVLTLPDYDQPQKIKNHFEVLRCFDILLLNFSSFTQEFLYQRSKAVNEEEKMKAIVVLTHLLSSSEKAVSENLIVISKENIGIDNVTIKMKRVLLKAIVALAYRQNLQEPNDHVLYEFIVKYICNTNNMNENDMHDFFNDCENSLYLLSSTVKNIQRILWPLLLKGFLQCKHSKSLSILAKCLNQILQMDDDESTEVPNEGGKLYVPTNEAVFVRCLSLLNYPHDEKMFRNIIAFLLRFCGDIHKNLAISWELDLKNLLTYLNSKTFSANVWECMILDLFRSAIYLVNDNSWIETVCHKILEQIPQCDLCITQKGILYKFLATLLCNMVDFQSVEYRLNIFFHSLPNCLPGEDVYVAQALGIASIKHGLRITEKLDDLCRDIDSRKSSGFLKFNFMKNHKLDVSMNNLKYSITLCYGEVAKELLDFKVLEKLVKTDTEGCGTLIRWIINIFQNTSSSLHLIQATINTTYLLAKAIQSIPHNVILQDRWKLLNLVLDQMLDSNPTHDTIQLFPEIINATSTLALLPKYLLPEERNAILRIIFSKSFNSINNSFNKEGNSQISEEEFNKILTDIQYSLDSLVREFIMQSTCPSTLDDILSVLDEWINHDCRHIRLAAVQSIQTALVSFIKNIKLTYENPSRFNQSGIILGRMISKCADDYSTVRRTSVNCIKVIIQIINLYEGGLIEQQCEATLTKLENEICTEDLDALLNVFESIGVIVSDKVQHQQTMQLIESLLHGLQDSSSFKMCCNVVLNILFKTKGPELYQNVNSIMSLVLDALSKIQDSDDKSDLLQTVLTFTRHHLKPVVSYLLMQPLPFDRPVCECWNVLSHDSSISLHIVEYFLTSLQTESLFEEALKYDNEKVSTVQYLSIISALCEILSQPQTEKLCKEKFADLFSILFVTIMCFIGANPPAHSIQTEKKNEKFGFVPNTQSTKILPARVAIDAMKALLINANCIKAIDAFLMCNQLDSTESMISFMKNIRSIVAVFCDEYPHHVPKLVQSLNQYSRDPLIPKRVAVIAFFGHLLAFRCMDNSVILDTVMTTLNAGWRDTALEVRATSLSGLNNVKFLNKEQQEPLIQSVITKLHDGLDDLQGLNSSSNIPLIAMQSLNEFLTMSFMNNEIMELYSPISHRIKAFMNTEISSLREASIKLFGEIVVKHKSDAVKEQALTLFPCFLLHLADNDIEVVKACKHTLKKICPVFDAPLTNNMVQTHLIDSAKLHITNFTTDLIKSLVNERPAYIPQLIESTMNYLNSPWENIRANSVIIIGILFTNYDMALAKEEDFKNNVKSLTFRLMQLLKDKNNTVRASAATALSNLYQ